MQALPIFVKLDGVPVLLRGGGEGADPKRRLLEAAGAIIVDMPTPDTRIAVLAIDDAEEAAREAARWRDAGLIVNVVDKPALCDFSFPAIVDRAPVTIAIGTGGASATLAKTLRERLEALLPDGLGATADAVRAARADVNIRIDGSAGRRAFWDALMAPGAALDPLGDVADPGQAIRDALANAGDVRSSRHEIRPGLTDPDDLTLRDLRALSQADLVLVEAGACEAIADRARRDAERGTYRAGVPLPAEGRIVILRA